MAKSALQREIDDASRQFWQKREPQAVKKQQENSTAARHVRKIIQSAPEHLLAKEILRRRMKEKGRKDKADWQRNKRATAKTKKVLPVAGE